MRGMITIMGIMGLGTTTTTTTTRHAPATHAPMGVADAEPVRPRLIPRTRDRPPGRFRVLTGAAPGPARATSASMILKFAQLGTRDATLCLPMRKLALVLTLAATCSAVAVPTRAQAQPAKSDVTKAAREAETSENLERQGIVPMGHGEAVRHRSDDSASSSTWGWGCRSDR